MSRERVQGRLYLVLEGGGIMMDLDWVEATVTSELDTSQLRTVRTLELGATITSEMHVDPSAETHHPSSLEQNTGTVRH